MNMHVAASPGAAPPPSIGDTPSARRWIKVLNRYRQPSRRRSAGELAVSLAPFLTLWALALA